jgi:hypothetical protein
LAGLYTIGFALAYVWLGTLRRRTIYLVLGALAACFLVNYGMMTLKLLDLVGENQTLIPWEDQILTGRWKRI